ncbi:hypothetical protein [Dokdonella ginsengisoli]|uniref:Glycosyltransferase RgtA/B/C/D-like domain-containing protein n=1 Tax=Dokdonella ginsengisoli TaxID=363846 RepID=A0ABV9QUT2_9GAMM
MIRPKARSLRLILERSDEWIARFLLVFAAGMLAFYLLVTYRTLFHSDSAMKLLLGEEMARRFALFPRDWNYVNDIPTVFPTLFAAPLSLLFAPSFPLHAVVDLLAAACVLYSAWFASREAGVDGPLRLLLPTALATGLSAPFSEAVFGQSAYSGPVFVLLMLAGWTCRHLALQPGAADLALRRARIGIAVVIAAGVAGGPRGIATYSAPMLLALAGFHFFAAPEGEVWRRRLWNLLVVVLAATVLGGLLFLLLVSLVAYHSGAASQAFANDEQILHNLQLFASNWLALFDASAPPGRRFGGLAAAVYVSRVCVAAAVFLLPLALVSRLNQLASLPLRFLVLLHLALVVTTGYVLVFSTIQGQTGSPRYLVPCVATGLLATACWLHEAGRVRRVRTAWLGFAMIAALLTLAPLQLVGKAFLDWRNPAAGLRGNPHDEIVAALRKAGLTRGYATYWNAGALTVLSGGDVRVAPVVFSPGSLPAPFHHLSAESWYAADWATGPSFLLLGGDESAELNRPTLRKLAGDPSETLRIGNFEVLVYPFNVGERIGYGAQPYVRLPKMTAQTCAAEFQPLETALALTAGEFGYLQVKAVNRSTITWSQNSLPYFNPGVRVSDLEGGQMSEHRATLPEAVPPGGSVLLTLPFRAPAAGEYELRAGFVSEGDAWCGDLASNWVKIPLSVKP